ncbi:MAG: hypothetical protein KDA87_03745 [Planctomycetales bacterium]|nr:hypothetical protein [Planctomycetales bacterium]
METIVEPADSTATDSTLTSTADDSGHSNRSGGSKRDNKPNAAFVREPNRDTSTTATPIESDESAVRPATATSRGFFPQIKFSKLPVWGWAVVAAFVVWVFYPSNQGPEIANSPDKPGMEISKDPLANVTSVPIQRKMETVETPGTSSPQVATDATTKQQGPSPLMDKLEKVEQAVLEKRSQPEPNPATARQPETSEPTQVVESTPAPSPPDARPEFGLQPPSNGPPVEDWFHDTFSSDSSSANQDTESRPASAPQDIQAYRPEAGTSANANPSNRTPESYVQFDGNEFGTEPDFRAAVDQFAQNRSATRPSTTAFDPYTSPYEYATGQRRASTDLDAGQPTKSGPTYPVTDVRNYDFPEDAVYRVVRQLGARR